MAVERNDRPKCSFCDVEKRETNHWYLLFAKKAGDVAFVAISEWSEEDASQAGAAACGQSCAQKGISRWFETRTFEKPLCSETAHR